MLKSRNANHSPDPLLKSPNPLLFFLRYVGNGTSEGETEVEGRTRKRTTKPTSLESSSSDDEQPTMTTPTRPTKSLAQTPPLQSWTRPGVPVPKKNLPQTPTQTPARDSSSIAKLELNQNIILKELFVVQKNQEEILSLLKNIKKKERKSTVDYTIFAKKINTLQGMYNLEEKLKTDPTFKEDVKNNLKLSVGSDGPASARQFLQKIGEPNVWAEFSFSGQRVKKDLQKPGMISSIPVLLHLIKG